MAEQQRLAVNVGGLHIANIEKRRWNDLRCRYTPAALDRWPQNTPLLSCSLPLGPKALAATTFCRGLLAEGRALDAMAARTGRATIDTFELLAHFGRDVAGALSLLPPADQPARREPTTETYADDELRTAVAELDEYPLGIHDDSELSLAGLQNKLLLVEAKDGWARPVGGAPSTHILKLDDPRFPGLVAAEHACLALARAAGLEAANSTLTTIGDEQCLIVERYDRHRNADGRIERIHQEDLCQALAIDTDAAGGRAKYERAGGPSFAQAATLLDQFAADGEAEQQRLLAAATFTVLIGNADAHGKNLSLLHHPLGETGLAPLYDTVPTVLWPKLRAEPAMLIGGCRDIRAMTHQHLLAEARSWGLRPDAVNATIEDVRARTLQGLAALPNDQEALAAQVRAAAARLAG